MSLLSDTDFKRYQQSSAAQQYQSLTDTTEQEFQQSVLHNRHACTHVNTAFSILAVGHVILVVYTKAKIVQVGECFRVIIESVLALDEVQLKEKEQHHYIWQEQGIHNE